MQTGTTKPLEIGGMAIGPDHDVFVIAEVGQAHDGSLGQAHAYIDAIARTGAHAVKFQTHIAEAESSAEEAFRVNFSYEDKTRFDYWKRMEFTPEQWAGLKRHADEKGLLFLSSAFSMEAVELLRNLGMPAWKVASGETTNHLMIGAMAADGKPILISTGLSPWEDVADAVACVESLGNQYGVFQCTSAYPVPADEVGLNIIPEIHRRFGCAAGLSDHSGDVFASVASVALGADLIELHAVFSKDCFGPDTKASLTIAEMTHAVQGCQSIRRAMQNPVDKDVLAARNAHLRIAFGKSLFAARALSKGVALQEGDVSLKKPATGIPARQLGSFIGRTLVRDIARGHRLALEDFE